MSKGITLGDAINEALATPEDPLKAEKQETLVRAISDVLLNERLGAEILIPGVESVAPQRKITMSIVRVLAQRGFVIADDKLQATVSERLGAAMPSLPNFPATTPSAKPIISAAWPTMGDLPSPVLMDTPSVRGLEAAH
jgi:hypothetical protein